MNQTSVIILNVIKNLSKRQRFKTYCSKIVKKFDLLVKLFKKALMRVLIINPKNITRNLKLFT